MTWFKDDFALPVREGIDTGGAQERIMRDFTGGVAGIRTVEEVNPDGSVTTLRTRLGRPIYETSQVRVISVAAPQHRGFVAKAPGGKVVLFDPYTLEVLQTSYTPAAKPYEVEDFLTGDTWYDVVLFDGTTIKVNAKAMPTLRITASHGYDAIPHVINFTVGDQYGNVERNATEKRVFAVGRYSVTAWGGGGVTETLTPTEPRTESRAMTIGQRVDPATDTAYLGELYHGADGWDGATEWYFRTAEVQMLLTSAYLVKTLAGANVAMSPPTLVAAGTSGGTMNTSVVLPEAEVGMFGSGEVSSLVLYDMYTLPHATIIWPWASVISKPLNGKVQATYTRTTYSGTASSTEAQAGVSIDYTASNEKTWDVRNETTSVDNQSVLLTDLPAITNAPNGISQLDDVLMWGDTPPGPTSSEVYGHVKTGSRLHTVDGGTLSGSSVTGRAYETQNASFSVENEGEQLVNVTLFREKSSGSKAVLTKRTGYYDGFLANPYGWIGSGSGLGIGSAEYLLTRTYPGNDDATPIFWYKATGDVSTRYQSPEAIAEINAFFSEMVTAYASISYVGSESESGYNNPNLYWVSVNPSVTLDNNALTWSTKDFILYDPTNEVYISVEGSFTGVDNVATLIVLLKVQTRHHTTTQTLGTFSYTYTEMLPEREIDTGRYAVPSPQIRAIFAPLYQEQGAFKGAHYVTKAEEAGGIVSFHGFNFVLNLRMYADFDTCNDDNDGEQVYFVPCNLLEMLYAFVFSTELGVAEDGTRYPVTYTARYEAMRDTLFSTPIRVSVRDGASTNWTSSLGSDFAAIGTTALYRT